MPSELTVLCLECLSAAAIEWRTIITPPENGRVIFIAHT